MITNKEIQNVVGGLRGFLGKKKAVLGLSGGIDSSVVGCLAAQAISSWDVYGIMMPYGDQSVSDSLEVARFLKINPVIVDIKPEVDSKMAKIMSAGYDIVGHMGDNARSLVLGNLKARERMSILYAFAGCLGGFVLGTSNKTELMIGYLTKHGDGACDIEVIGDFFKGEVYELARTFGHFPPKVYDKPPSAELWDGQTDEEEIGITYHHLDNLLKEILVQGIDDYKDDVPGDDGKVIRMVRESAHKRNPAPVIKRGE